MQVLQVPLLQVLSEREAEHCHLESFDICISWIPKQMCVDHHKLLSGSCARATQGDNSLCRHKQFLRICDADGAMQGTLLTSLSASATFARKDLNRACLLSSLKTAPALSPNSTRRLQKAIGYLANRMYVSTHSQLCRKAYPSAVDHNRAATWTGHKWHRETAEEETILIEQTHC